MYNNAVGIMTNDPWYPWHVQNINTYAWISNEVPSQKDLQVETGDLLPNQDEVPGWPHIWEKLERFTDKSSAFKVAGDFNHRWS